MVLLFRRCLQVLSVRIALYLISLLLWLVLIHVELRNCPVPGTKTWSSTPVLCSVSHLIFPWLKSPIMIQSPLLTSLMALCIFSLFSLVMLGQRYTTPMAGLDIKLVDAVARGASRFENLLAPPKTYWPPQKLTGPFLRYISLRYDINAS